MEAEKAREEATEQRERADKAERALEKHLSQGRRDSAEGGGVGVVVEGVKRGGVRELSLGFGGEMRGVAKEGRVERKGQGKGQVKESWRLADLFRLFRVFLGERSNQNPIWCVNKEGYMVFGYRGL